MQANQNRKTAIILAAGDGKRMKSSRPKVLCEVLFKPMLNWVEDACRKAGIAEVYVVAGAQAELLRQAAPDCKFAIQQERKGTGHAVMMAAEAFAAGGDVLVLYGDAPFISAQVIQDTYEFHKKQGNAVTIVSASLDNPTGYGRIVRSENGQVAGIIEQKDASEEILRIREVNSGLYWFDAGFLEQALAQITNDNAQGEYYLTDTVKIAVQCKKQVDAFVCEDSDVILGANDRKGLKALNEIARQRIMGQHLENGVDIPCDDGVIIGQDAKIGPDSRILPGTIIKGHTCIGSGTVIGPNSYLENVQVGDGAQILSSWLADSKVGNGTSIGPYSQLRPGSEIGCEVKIGDFVEIKNSTIGDKTSIAHLTYIGDSDVGKLCNFGCGVVTANYDGKKKFRTKIGDRAFIGCNTNLIPPVEVGAGAYTAAGTTIDEDVPAGALAIGRVRQQVKEEWASQQINFKADQE